MLSGYRYKKVLFKRKCYRTRSKRRTISDMKLVLLPAQHWQGVTAYHAGFGASLLRLEEDGFFMAANGARLVGSREL